MKLLIVPHLILGQLKDWDLNPLATLVTLVTFYLYEVMWEVILTKHFPKKEIMVFSIAVLGTLIHGGSELCTG